MEDEDEDEDHFGNKDPLDGYLLHHPGDYTWESRNAKRKVESAYGLFCVMRKRTCRHNNSVDDLVDDSDSGDGSDAELSEFSEFDVLSQHVVQEKDFICNFPCPSEDEGTLVSKLSSETQNPILLLSRDEANEENGTRSKEDEVLSFVSASPNEFQSTSDPQIFSGHSNEISLFHSEREKDKLSCIPGICEDILRCSSINKEGPEVQCNSDVFKNDGETSSATEVRYGDVVNMQGSLEKMSSSDNITLVNKDGEPVPISSFPPDGGSSILLETFSLHPIVRCLNEYNVHDGKIGLEISPIRLTKTFEGPSRPWSVCGSTAAVRNIPLLEDGSGACSSLDEQLYVNVSSSECRDAEFSRTPSTLYQEEEVDGEDEISFSDIDAMIRKLTDDSDSCLNGEEWNMSKHPSDTLLGLEHCTRTSIQRAFICQGAIAVLHCRDSKHFIRKHEVIIGRSSYGMNVDIDLGKDGYGSKISRRQALVKLEKKGSFTLTNLGKGHILVNGEKLNRGQIVSLTSCSWIDIRGIVFEFKVNKEAVRQFLKNNTRRNSEDDTKFRWCE